MYLSPILKMEGKKILLLLSLLFVFAIPSFSFPLSTKGRWTVDDKTGKRVKLICANWPSHVEPMLTEGLDKQPLSYLVSQLNKLKYNCVRFTWATYMFTRYSNVSVVESLDSFNLTKAKAGIAKHNPSFLNLNLVQAFQAVVDEFGKQGIMVVFDNQVSRPTWCCGYDDGNGFFGDKDFDPNEWLQGLDIISKLFKGKSQVVGISTRNEVRGPRSNLEDWYKYMLLAGETIHKANPDVLIFASGIGYASDLTCLKEKPLGTTFDNKLVYEAHWYPFSWGHGDNWKKNDINEVCYNETQYFHNKTGFVMNGENPFPMFIGEFGIDQRGLSLRDERFLACFNAYAAEYDLEWGIWAWQGSYYYRENKTGTVETFSVMDFNWNRVRNPEFDKRINLIKMKLREPSSRAGISYILFHPHSGSCIHAEGEEGIYASSCEAPRRWVYKRNGSSIRLKGTELCLKAVGDGQEPILSTDCSSKQSTWNLLTKTKLHVAALDENGEQLCLQKESPYTSRIVTTKCNLSHMEQDEKCEQDPHKDPITQWFQFVKTNVL